MAKEHILQDSDLTAPERERVEAALMPEEHVLWVGRPSPKGSPWSGVILLIWALIVPGTVVWVFLSNNITPGPDSYLFLAFVLLFTVFPLGSALIRIMKHRLSRYSFYVLTEGRALAFHRSLWGKPVLKSWASEDIIRLEEYSDGSGSLVFEIRVRRTKHGEVEETEGLVDIPNISSVKEMVQPYLPKEEEEGAEEEEAPLSPRERLRTSIILSVFVVIGLVLSGTAVYCGVRTVHQVKTYTETEATVIGKEWRTHSTKHGSRREWHTRYQYEVDGHTYQGTLGTSETPKPFKRGASLPILYNPEAPEESIGNQFFELWGFVLIPGGIGLVFLLVGVFALRSHLKSGRPGAKEACQEEPERV